MKIFGDKRSGNCYKIELCCHLLGIEYQFVPIDVMHGETQTPQFLSLNPNGRIPLVEFDDGRVLCESNAIINYLALGSTLLPEEPFELARMQQWQFFEQYSHEPYIAVRRFISKFQRMPESRVDEYHAKEAGGKKALRVMAQQLEKSAYLVAGTLSNADISLYAYTHNAHEAGFKLGDYPSIEQWISRIQSHSRFFAMA